MSGIEQIKEDLITMNVDDSQELTKKYVTARYKKLAKDRHPDKEGGTKEAFQELQNAYLRIISFLEEKEIKEASEDVVVDFETEFFKKHNIVKECTASFVIYIQDSYVDRWRKVLERHITLHRPDKGRTIFKAGKITVTLYDKPKKDPRSKLHIQSGDQNKNLEFILDCLSLFYREVCCMSGGTTLEDKSSQKSICPKCGKQFVNKKGLKQHNQRMHSSKKGKRISMKDIPVISDEILIISDSSPKDIPLATALYMSVPEPVNQDAMKSQQQQERINDAGVSNESSVNNEYIEDLVNSILGNAIDACQPYLPNEEEVESNYQCGECGKTFGTVAESEYHIESYHANADCERCASNDKVIKRLSAQLKEKDKEILEISQKSEYVVRKNVEVDKEIRRIKQAFKESLYEKEQLNKRMSSQNESMNEILKQNTTLNDDIKVKENLIKLLRVTVQNDNVQQEDTPEIIIEDPNSKEDTAKEKSLGESDDREKCNECDFKTRVRKYMKSHKMAHEGQYQCQRGCKLKFKTLRILDEHHKSKHAIKQTVEYKCDKCNLSFTSQHHLRQHLNTKHVMQTPSKEMRLFCEFCGLITNNQEDLINHKATCNAGYQQVGNKVCKYFDNGGCFRGNSCRFSHPKEKQQSTPHCKNGFSCRFLANSCCFFFHRGVGVQKQRNQEVYQKRQNVNASKPWCKYLEDCSRVPNCPFLHAEEDFPELPKTNPPPIRSETQGWWEDY